MPNNPEPRISTPPWLSPRSFSALEVLIVMVLLSAGLLPIFFSLGSGRRGTVKSESQFFGEQYALEIAQLLSILDGPRAKSFAADLSAGNSSNELVKSLSSLKPGYKRKVDSKEIELKDVIDGVTKTIKFIVFTVDVEIPGLKPNETQHFMLSKMVRETVINK